LLVFLSVIISIRFNGDKQIASSICRKIVSVGLDPEKNCRGAVDVLGMSFSSMIDHLISSYNALYEVNLSTNVKTLIEENNNNGKSIGGIFEKEDGYFITGSYYPTDTNDVESVDAFLMEVDLAFETVQELVLSGSGDDQGGTIALNSSGQPVWMVSSNSTDGDFAAFAASNPTNRFNNYSVSF
jgi:hypothetical protein